MTEGSYSYFLAVTLISFVSRFTRVPGSMFCLRLAQVGLCSVTAIITRTATTPALRSDRFIFTLSTHVISKLVLSLREQRCTEQLLADLRKSVRYFHAAQDAAQMSCKRDNQDSNERERPISSAQVVVIRSFYSCSPPSK